MSSGVEWQPNGRLRRLEQGDTPVVVLSEAGAPTVRRQVQGRDRLRGPARVQQAPGPSGKRPLPDAWRALHRPEDPRGTPAHRWRGNTTGDVTVSPRERRERGGLYYTRSRKVNGRVVREYVGGGVLGELVTSASKPNIWPNPWHPNPP